MLAKCAACEWLDEKDVNGVLYHSCRADYCRTDCQPCVKAAWMTAPLEAVCPQVKP